MKNMRTPDDGHTNAEAYRLLGHTLRSTVAPFLSQPSLSEAPL